MTTIKTSVEKVNDPRFTFKRQAEAAEFSAQLTTQTAAGIHADRTDHFKADHARDSLDSSYPRNQYSSTHFHSSDALFTVKAELPIDPTKKIFHRRRKLRNLFRDRIYMITGFTIGLILCLFFIGIANFLDDDQTESNAGKLTTSQSQRQMEQRLTRSRNTREMTNPSQNRRVSIQRGGVQAAYADSKSPRPARARRFRANHKMKATAPARHAQKRTVEYNQDGQTRTPSKWLPPRK